jgi:hypothetical protein
MGSTGQRFNGCGHIDQIGRQKVALPIASPNSLLTGKITGKISSLLGG